MAGSRSWSEAIRIARRPEHAVAGALVIAAGAGLGLALLAAMARTVTFPPVAHPEAVGWTTVHGYPEYQEQLYFVLAVAGVPALSGLCWLAWARVVAAGEGALSRSARALSRSARAVIPSRARAAPTPAVISAGAWPASTPAAASPLRRAFRAFPTVLTWVVAPMLLYWILFEPLLPDGLDPFHDAESLVPLLELRRGGVPYRDFYLQHGLLHNALIPWLGAKLFGPTVEGVWRIQRVVEPLGAVCLYYFAVTVYRGRGITASVLAFLLCGAVIGVPGRAAFGFLALALVAASVPNCRSWLLALAGLLTAAAVWHSVEVGIFSAAAIVAFVLMGGCRPRRRALGWFCAGISVGLASVGLVFLWHGALDDLVHNFIVQTAHQSEAWGLPLPNFFATVAGLADLQWPQSFAQREMLFYLPPALLLLASLWLVSRLVQGKLLGSPADLRLLLVVLAGACFFRVVLGRSDDDHLPYGIVFMTLLAMYVPDRLLTGARSWPRVLAGLAAVAVVGSYAWSVYRPWHGLLRRLEPAAISLVADPAEPFAPVIEAIRGRTDPGESVFDFTNQGALLFLADRSSATRYFQAVYVVNESIQLEVIETLERLRPLVILESGSVTDSLDGVPQSLRTPLLAEYLRANYEREPVSGTPYVLGIPKHTVVPERAVKPAETLDAAAATSTDARR